MTTRSLLSTRCRSASRVLACIGVLVMGVVPAAEAVVVAGRVTDAGGQPLPFVRIRVTPARAVPHSSTVFSAADGTFEVDYQRAASRGLAIEAFRIGWKEASRKVRVDADVVAVDVVMHRITNVADQVPASAWLKGDPSSQAYQMTTLQCSNCHQLGAYRVRKFSASMSTLPPGDRAEAWVKRAADDLAGPAADGTETKPSDAPPAHTRVAGWESMVQYMRLVTMQLGEDRALRWNLTVGSPYFNALLQPETSLFSPADMAIIVPNLARYYPVAFDSYTDYDDIERLGDYGVNRRTRIDEFVLPTFGWTREVAIAPGSNKVWFVETDKDRLGALDPGDGSVQWYPVPGSGRQGPHTMNSDASGHVWAGLEDSFHLARLDTKTGRWRLYPPPAGTVFGVTHDFAYDSNRHVATDAKGRIFITDMGKNELWAVNVDTGQVQTYRQPLPQGESHFHSLMYGAAIDPKRNRVWWAQLYGNVGSFDTEDDVAEHLIPFRRGEGPRRLAVAEDGKLWIPLFGSSQLVEIDSDTAAELGRYQIPDRGAAPYGITLDKKRNAIWAATSNSDRIYRFDIATRKWTHYPLPRKEAYIRMIELDPVTNDVWTAYASLPVGKRDPLVFGTESANNMLVRLHPGD